MKKLTAILFFTILLPRYAYCQKASPSRLLGCWDHTYAYNIFNIERSAKFFYVTFVGSSLTNSGFDIGNTTENFHLYPQWDSNRAPITIPFSHSQCTWNETNQTLECNSGLTDTPSRKNRKIFVSRLVDNLGTVETIVSGFDTYTINLKASPHGATLTHSNFYYGGTVASQVLEVKGYRFENTLECNDKAPNSLIDSALAPQNLIDYLEN